jgi:hypothetical protein
LNVKYKKSKKTKWGGPRKRAGHPKTGITKMKICVSVNRAVWQSALSLWRGKQSPLVEKLLSDYVDDAGKKPQANAK